MKLFLFVFYHHSAQQVQTHRVKAKNKHVARHIFWERYSRNVVEIEHIEEL